MGKKVDELLTEGINEMQSLFGFTRTGSPSQE
jgi:hypothetical protein